MPMTRPTAVARARNLRSPEGLAALLRENGHARPLSWYRPKQKIHVADRMQTRYCYTLEVAPGRSLGFAPHLTPAQMLARGVFEGKYLNDCVLEFPREWFEGALSRLSPGAPNPGLNEFGVKSRKSLGYWRKKGWVPIVPGDPDVRGWFQWYCRYWLGRRVPGLDEVQIKRWKAFRRHAGQIATSYRTMRDPPRTKAEKRVHRPRQRQALLQWAYDPYV
jgi:hypothetical protein